MYKFLKKPAVECLKNGNYHVYNIFSNGSQRQKIARIRKQTELKKINRTLKLCTLATNNLILSRPAIDP